MARGLDEEDMVLVLSGFDRQDGRDALARNETVEAIGDDAVAVLQRAAHEELFAALMHHLELAALDGANALLGYCSEELLQAAGSLHWVQMYSAGVERCTDLEMVKNGNYLVTNGQHVSSPALAETSIAMMMFLASCTSSPTLT